MIPRLALILLFSIAAIVPARAFDLNEVRRDGQLVAQALSMGAGGDWEAAQALVAGQHPVVRDIVLWRKLRARKGTADEFRDFASRRLDWPGAKSLGAVYGVYVGGGGGGARTGSLSGAPAESYAAFRAAQRKDEYETAEQLIIAASASRASLGVPKEWAKRRLSAARRAAREGRATAAYSIASKHFLTPADGYDYSDCEWVAGWVALRKLKDPKRAIAHFKRFRDSVETPISLGRGGYWLGRAYEAAGNSDAARRWYADGAQYQTSFYGQLAAAKIGAAGDSQLAATGLPDWRSSAAAKGDTARMAATMYYAGQDTLAMATFSRLGSDAPIATLAPLTKLALDLGAPHYAIRAAKKAARRGVLIYPAYYPVHQMVRHTSKVEPAFALSVARTETELNARAISKAGARGLMQLMPGTAKKVAGWIGEEYSRNRLIDDWRYNVRLGETYLARRVSDFGGSYFMAAAAYNAGASRVDRWIGEYGDPRRGQIDIVDWIEQIPFNETRNYVQRVMEGLHVYRARLKGSVGAVTLEQDLRRGFTR